MKLKTIDLGGITLKNNLLVAPLAGYTDFAFRTLCSRLGAGLTFSEMVSAKGLIYNNRGTKELLRKADGNDAVQLFGNEPQVLNTAAKSEELAAYGIIDINMGCPVPKVFNNGEGSALLDDPPLAGRLVAAVAAAGKTVTVKIRLGSEKGRSTAVEVARAAADNGAALITVHGRYRPDYYSGEVDYDGIARVKNAVGIPVIANGGVFNEDDAANLAERTGADGVMLARGAFYDPLLIARLTKTPVEMTLKGFIVAHIDMLKTVFPDTYVARNFRKIMPCYLKRVACDKKLKTAFATVADTEEIKRLLDEVFGA